MRGIWETLRRNEEDESIVVIPSVSVDRINERSGSLQQAYEERLLVLLLLLRQPRLRIIYVTSMPIAPKIVEYYLGLFAERLQHPIDGQAGTQPVAVRTDMGSDHEALLLFNELNYLTQHMKRKAKTNPASTG